jgi:hypothetical protein
MKISFLSAISYVFLAVIFLLTLIDAAYGVIISLGVGFDTFSGIALELSAVIPFFAVPIVFKNSKVGAILLGLITMGAWLVMIRLALEECRRHSCQTASSLPLAAEMFHSPNVLLPLAATVFAIAAAVLQGLNKKRQLFAEGT